MSLLLPHGLKIDQVKRYLENRTKEFGTLGTALTAKDIPAIRTLAHRIKGNAALYAMPELGHRAGTLLAAADAEDWALISERIDGLIIQLEVEKRRFS